MSQISQALFPWGGKEKNPTNTNKKKKVKNSMNKQGKNQTERNKNKIPNKTKHFLARNSGQEMKGVFLQWLLLKILYKI